MFRALDAEALGNPIRTLWDGLYRVPGGKRIYSRILGTFAPYTGSIPFTVVELRRGISRVELADRPKVRNHLRCVHAIALINLSEIAGNLALGYALPDDARFIVASIRMDYLKKARGTITATCEIDPPSDATTRVLEIPVTLRNAAGETVATAVVTSKVSTKKA